MNKFEAGELAMERRAMIEEERAASEEVAEIDRVAWWLSDTDEGFVAFTDIAFSDNSFTDDLDEVLRMALKRKMAREEDFAAIGRALCLLVDETVKRISNDQWEKISEWVEE